MTETVLTFGNRVHRISPAMRLIRMIEEELGPVPQLAEKLSSQAWKVSDLVALTHMMLEEAGESVDYLALGDRMIADGLGGYRKSAQKFLETVLA